MCMLYSSICLLVQFEFVPVQVFLNWYRFFWTGTSFFLSIEVSNPNITGHMVLCLWNNVLKLEYLKWLGLPYVRVRVC